MPRNVELKAVLPDPAAAAARARELAGEPHEILRQEDTYFRVPHGRLKLRRRWSVGGDGEDERELPSELIAYHRPDSTEAKASDYAVLALPPGTKLAEVLALAAGVDAVVEKLRTVFLYRNVRIHLDEVRGLGSFLEFEAVLDERCDEAAAHALLAELEAWFDIRPEHRRAGSYREMVV